MEKHRPEDDLFKKILADHPDFEPSKSDINDMRNRLDAVDHSNQKGGFGFGFWWLPLLLLPFIFATSFLFYQNQKLDHQVQALSSTLSTLQKDTFQHNYITYHFDTIYKTIYLDQVIERKSIKNYQNQNTSTLNNLSANFKELMLQSPSEYFIFKNQNSNQNPFIYGGSKTSTTLQVYNSAREKFQNMDMANRPKDRFGNAITSAQNPLFISSLFSLLEKNKNVNILLENINPVFEFKIQRRNPMRHFTPKGFRIGMVGTPYSSTKIKSETFRRTYSFGMESEIAFNKNVRLLLGIRSMSINSEEKDPNITALYPSIMPNDPTDNLREVYMTLNQLQVPIMLKYLFSKNKKWQPFFAFGIVANRPFRQKFKHKFINTSLEEYEVLQNFRSGAFSIKNFEGAFGVETNLTAKISGSTSIYYLHDFELGAGEYFLWRNTGLNIGLKYKL